MLQLNTPTKHRAQILRPSESPLTSRDALLRRIPHARVLEGDAPKEVTPNELKIGARPGESLRAGSSLLHLIKNPSRRDASQSEPWRNSAREVRAEMGRHPRTGCVLGTGATRLLDIVRDAKLRFGLPSRDGADTGWAVWDTRGRIVNTQGGQCRYLTGRHTGGHLRNGFWDWERGANGAPLLHLLTEIRVDIRHGLEIEREIIVMVQSIRPEELDLNILLLEGLLKLGLNLLVFIHNFTMEEDGTGVELPTQLRDDLLRLANSHDEVGALRLQGATQIGDALEQEPRAVLACFLEAVLRAAEMAGVEAVDGDDGRGVLDGMREGGVVVEAEVRPEEHDDLAGALAEGGVAVVEVGLPLRGELRGQAGRRGGGVLPRRRDGGRERRADRARGGGQADRLDGGGIGDEAGAIGGRRHVWCVVMWKTAKAASVAMGWRWGNGRDERG